MMIFYSSTMMRGQMKLFRIDCSCGTESLEFNRWGDDPVEDDVYIAHTICSFRARQVGIFGELLSRLKLAWLMLRGREYTFYEINIDAKRLAEFKEWVVGL